MVKRVNRFGKMKRFTICDTEPQLVMVHKLSQRCDAEPVLQFFYRVVARDDHSVRKGLVPFSSDSHCVFQCKCKEFQYKAAAMKCCFFQDCYSQCISCAPSPMDLHFWSLMFGSTVACFQCRTSWNLILSLRCCFYTKIEVTHNLPLYLNNYLTCLTLLLLLNNANICPTNVQHTQHPLRKLFILTCTWELGQRHR